MFKMCCGIPNAYILDITMYKMRVLLCSVIIEIQPLNTGDKSLNISQEYNVNIGKISLTKRNITA